MGGQGSGPLAGQEAHSPRGMSSNQPSPLSCCGNFFPRSSTVLSAPWTHLRDFFLRGLANCYIKRTKKREEKKIKSFHQHKKKKKYPFNLARQRIFKLHPAMKSVIPPTFHMLPQSLLRLFYSSGSSHPPSPYPALCLTHHPQTQASIWSKHEDPTNPLHTYSQVKIPAHTAASNPHQKSLTSKREVSHDTQLAPHPLPVKLFNAQLPFRK